jgi:2-acylglycerol O-acyltransferase 2
MPFLPAGYKGFLPLPAPLPLSFVVGQPVEVPPPGPDGVAAEEDVARVCVEYYAKVEELFHRYKASSGFPHLELVLKHD